MCRNHFISFPVLFYSDLSCQFCFELDVSDVSISYRVLPLTRSYFLVSASYANCWWYHWSNAVEKCTEGKLNGSFKPALNETSLSFFLNWLNTELNPLSAAHAIQLLSNSCWNLGHWMNYQSPPTFIFRQLPYFTICFCFLFSSSPGGQHLP